MHYCFISKVEYSFLYKNCNKLYLYVWNCLRI